MKEVFKLFIGKHFVNQFEDGLFIVLVKLLDKAHLLYGRFIFHNLQIARCSVGQKRWGTPIENAVGYYILRKKKMEQIIQAHNFLKQSLFLNFK